MHPNLSFEQSPPIAVPYRFFLTAPWFGVAAGLLLVLQGGGMLATRWMPELLGATHLLVTGFMLQAMCGAMMQFVPVAAGGNIWRPRLVAGIVHPLLIAASCLLVAAFLTYRPVLFAAAAHVFLLALGLFGIVVGSAVWRTPAQGPTIVALRIALLGLLVTVGLGATLATGLASGARWPLPLLTDIHAGWGLGGWALVLLAGVSYFVVPMFQLTPAYPAWVARGVPLLLLCVLLVWSLQFFGFDPAVRLVVLFAGLAVAALFAAQTLRLQYRRRRKVSDTTLLFFRTAMISLLAVLVSVVLFAAVPQLGEDARATVWLGILTVIGVFVSAINGMLYKIVPFLNWLHLQQLGGLGVLPPSMNQMLADRMMRRQYYAHLLALALLLLAVWMPLLARLAGLAFAVDCGWLGLNLLTALRAYRRFKDRIRAAA